MQNQTCLFCGHNVSLVHVHGHYQCPVCKTNALPCCDGDNCETNTLLKNNVAEINRAPADNPADNYTSFN